MNNQWKMAPAEPTDAMVEAGFQVADITMEHDSELGSTAFLNNLDEIFKAMLTAAPVPPAGDVARFCIYNEDGKLSLRPAADGYWCKHDDFTRLTAERDGLLTNVNELTEHRDELKMQRDRWVRMHNNLQSELTKALSWLGHAKPLLHSGGFNLAADDIGNFLASHSATPIAHNADESCGQDAETARGGA